MSQTTRTRKLFAIIRSADQVYHNGAYGRWAFNTAISQQMWLCGSLSQAKARMTRIIKENERQKKFNEDNSPLMGYNDMAIIEIEETLTITPMSTIVYDGPRA